MGTDARDRYNRGEIAHAPTGDRPERHGIGPLPEGFESEELAKTLGLHLARAAQARGAGLAGVLCRSRRIGSASRWCVGRRRVCSTAGS